MFSPESSRLFLLTVLIFSVCEFLIRRRKGLSYDGAAVASTVVIAIGQVLSRVPTAILISTVFLGAYAVAPIQLETSDWWAWIVGFFAVEFFYYWQHRFSHTIRWFWATHSVHHSPNEFTFPVAFRLGWTGTISGTWIFLLPIALLGVPPLMIGVLMTLNLQYQFFLHTELIGKLGPLEWILNTPSHHRVHHGSNKEYLDKNYGGVLIVFDRLFGTFAEEDHRVPVRYGLTEPILSKNPLTIVFREWRLLLGEVRTARTMRQAFHALVKKPGTPALKNEPAPVGAVSTTSV